MSSITDPIDVCEILRKIKAESSDPEWRAQCAAKRAARRTPRPVYTACGLKDLIASGEHHSRRAQGRAITEAEWAKAFMPFTNPRDGTLYFTPDEPLDAAFLEQMSDEHIWTDFDLNLAYLPYVDEIRYPGRYKVARLGYLVTIRPWKAEDENLAVYNYDDVGYGD
jgi:hypothetical protein